MIDLIRLLLTPNPKDRPTIFDIESILNNYDNLKNLTLNVIKI